MPPTPPPGFTIDSTSGGPPAPPEGFTLDSQATATIPPPPSGFQVDSPAPSIPQPPAGFQLDTPAPNKNQPILADQPIQTSPIVSYNLAGPGGIPVPVAKPSTATDVPGSVADFSRQLAVQQHVAQPPPRQGAPTRADVLLAQQRERAAGIAQGNPAVFEAEMSNPVAARLQEQSGLGVESGIREATVGTGGSVRGAFAQGAGQLFSGPAKLVDAGIEATTGIDTNLGPTVQRGIERLNPTKPSADQSFLTGTLPRGAGSMAALAGTGPYALAAGTAMGAGEGYQRAEDLGGSGLQKAAMTAGGAALGATEAIPLARGMGRLAAPAAGGVARRVATNAGVQAFEEGVQEGSQQLGQNILDRATGLADTPLAQGVGEGVAAGAILGGVMGGAGSAISQPKPETSRFVLAQENKKWRVVDVNSPDVKYPLLEESAASHMAERMNTSTMPQQESANALQVAEEVAPADRPAVPAAEAGPGIEQAAETVLRQGDDVPGRSGDQAPAARPNPAVARYQTQARRVTGKADLVITPSDPESLSNEQVYVRDHAKRFGMDVVFVEPNPDAGTSGTFDGNTLVVQKDANAPGTYLHELFHALEQEDGGKHWNELLEDVRAEAPSQLAAALSDYYRTSQAKAPGVAKRLQRSPHMRKQEAVSNTAENLTHYILSSRLTPEYLESIAQRKPTLFQKIKDVLYRFINRTGLLGNRQTQAGQIESEAQRAQSTLSSSAFRAAQLFRQSLDAAEQRFKNRPPEAPVPVQPSPASVTAQDAPLESKTVAPSRAATPQSEDAIPRLDPTRGEGSLDTQSATAIADDPTLEEGQRVEGPKLKGRFTRAGVVKYLTERPEYKLSAMETFHQAVGGDSGMDALNVSSFAIPPDAIKSIEITGQSPNPPATKEGGAATPRTQQEKPNALQQEEAGQEAKAVPKFDRARDVKSHAPYEKEADKESEQRQRKLDEDKETMRLFALDREAGLPDKAGPKFKALAKKEWLEKGTESRFFKRWFKDSKVVDDKGKPLVVYHGTKAGAFDAFNIADATPSGAWPSGGLGAFFSPKDWAAEAYGPNVRAVYLKIENPYLMSADENGRITSRDQARAMRDRLMAEGYDGAIIGKGQEYVAFRPDQIKSATGNQGTFDPSNPNMLFALQRAYHGSPHTFDKFSTEKMGTGEGAQAFGWGMYFAGRKEVAEYYRRALSPGGGLSASDTAANVYNSMPDRMSEQEKTEASIRELEGRKARSKDPEFQGRMDEAIAAVKRGGLAGRLYEVNLKPEESDYLLWDKPLSEQSEKVREAIDAMFTRGWSAENSSMTGEQLYRRVSMTEQSDRGRAPRDDQQASQDLRSLGIRGIKFKDQDSRAGKTVFYDTNTKKHGVNGLDQQFDTREEAEKAADAKASYNYVIFDDADVEIEAMFALNRDTPLFPTGFDMPSEGVFDYLRRKVQDKFLPVKRTVESIKAQGGKVTEDIDPYLQEELFSGRTEARIEQFEQSVMPDLTKLMRSAKVSIADVDKYLYARHAPERNNRIAEINPEFAREGIPGSGMATDEANRVVKEMEASDKGNALKSIASIVDRINKDRLDLMQSEGLESREYLDTLRDGYKFYVPLRTDMNESGAKGMGRGFDIRGRESKRALGRKSQADSPLAFTLAQMEQTILRSEKNKVGQSLYHMIRANPDSDLWDIDHKPSRAIMDADGMVRYELDRRHKLADNVLSVKVDGKEHLITFHGDHGKRLANAMKNVGTESANRLVQAMGRVTRFLAMMNTTMDPEFMLTNLVRDLQTASINLGGERGAKITKEVVKRVPKAIKAAFRQSGNKEVKDDWDRYAREYKEDGGAIGFFGLQTIQDTIKEIEGKVKDLERSKANPRKLYRQTVDLIGRANSAVENGVRLSTYRTLRENGVSRKKAASAAKNLTVNFNRKGEAGAILNALYMFSNAGIQGSARMLNAMRSKRTRRIGYAVAGAAFLLDLLNRWISDEDEDGKMFYDKISDFEKSRNIILMLPGTDGNYFKFPLPYGYNIFHAVGQQFSAATFGNTSPGAAAMNLTSTAAESFNPLGGNESFLNMLLPTVLDPVAESAVNRNFAGTPIMPDDSPFGAPKPDSERSFERTSEVFKKPAETLNTLTGGDRFQPGLIDISPETIEHYTDFITGGLGRFANRLWTTGESLATDQELPTYKTPFLRRFYGEPSDIVTRDEFYTNIDSADIAYQRLKAAAQSGDSEAVMEAREKGGAALLARQRLNAYREKIQKLNAAARSTKDEKREEELEKLVIQTMKQANKAMHEMQTHYAERKKKKKELASVN